MIKRFLLVVLGALILVEIYVLLAGTWWGFELFTHYLHYYLLVGLIAFPFLLFKRMHIAILLLVTLMSMQMAEIAPFIKTNQEIASSDLTVLSNNFFILNEDYDAFSEMLATENPDVFALLEAHYSWKAEKERFREEYPYIFMTEETGPFGMIMASKYPAEFKAIKIEQFPAIEATVNINGEIVKIIAVHPIPPASREFAMRRNEAFEDLIHIVQKSEVPTIVMGDFNSSQWSPAFKNLVSKSNLFNARIGFGINSTWNEDIFFLSTPIDHILVSDDITVQDFHLGANTGSDHLPVIAKLSLPS